MADGLSTHEVGGVLPYLTHSLCKHDRSRLERKGLVMKANVGDWLVFKGGTNEQSERRGKITEVHGTDGAPPYMVRWLDTGHEALVFPGPDTIVVTPAEQEAADERARSRFASVQAAIMNRPTYHE
jgi:hypothetical protein